MRHLRLSDVSEMPVSDYTQPPQFDWREFYNFRNHVIQTLRRFGSAGPCGEADLSVSDDNGVSFESEVVDNPDFFVVDDMWNEHDRLSLVESDPEHITVSLIESLAEMTSTFPGWRVALKLGDCGIDVFGDKVLVGGRRFWDCKTVDDLVSRCVMPVDYGPVPPFSESMYHLWVAVITGRYGSGCEVGAPPDRQWREAILVLNQMAQRQDKGRPLNPYSYGRIRSDLHPQTRLQHVRHFMLNISDCGQKDLEEARSNVLLDAGEALSLPMSSDDFALLVGSISTAQISVSTWASPEDVLFWWPWVLSALGEPSETLKPILTAEFQRLLDSANSWIQLSAVFCLAILRIDGRAAVVDCASAKNVHWADNRDLRKWLQQLRVGSTSYPSLTLD